MLRTCQRCILGLVFWTLLASSTTGQQPTPGSSNPGPDPRYDKGAAPPPPRQDLPTLSAGRAMAWLARANKPDGRFVYGFLPALRVPLEGDSYPDQVGAAYALGQASRRLRDERSAAVARQAVLTMLLETTVDPKEKHIRHSAAPAALVNRVHAAGLLVLAIHELPDPAADLVEQADQLGNFLRKQLQADGSIKVQEDDDRPQGSAAAQAEAALHWSGPALYALIRSQRTRPAVWKQEALRKACPHYVAMWKQHKSLTGLSWHMAAYAEAFVQTKEKAFGEGVLEMADWLCSQQYRADDPRRARWAGGFIPAVDPRGGNAAPDIRSAQAAEGLAQACRVAAALGDVARHQRYRQCLENALAFLMTLQYTEATAQHFVEGFRPLVLGGFYASHQDGNLRVDYTQHALTALIWYGEYVAE